MDLSFGFHSNVGFRFKPQLPLGFLLLVRPGGLFTCSCYCSAVLSAQADFLTLSSSFSMISLNLFVKSSRLSSLVLSKLTMLLGKWIEGRWLLSFLHVKMCRPSELRTFLSLIFRGSIWVVFTPSFKCLFTACSNLYLKLCLFPISMIKPCLAQRFKNSTLVWQIGIFQFKFHEFIYNHHW